MVSSMRNNVNIWIPCFDLKDKSSYNKLHYLEDVKISHASGNYSALNILEHLDISMKYDPQIEVNCKLNDNPEDIVIKKNFLFSIINIDLATELNLAAIYVDYVKKDKWKEKI